MLDQVELDMEVDTGASRSLISKATFHTLQGKGLCAELRPSSAHLHTYTGEQLHVEGTIVVSVRYHQQVRQLELLVVKGTGPSLMGRDWLHHIRLDWHRLHSIQTQPQALESILQKYKEVFKEELGEIKRFQANLHVNPDQLPRFYRPRPVPYALRDRVEKELA